MIKYLKSVGVLLFLSTVCNGTVYANQEGRKTDVRVTQQNGTCTGVVKDADKTLDKYRGSAKQLAADGMLSFADSENIKNYLVSAVRTVRFALRNRMFFVAET